MRYLLREGGVPYFFKNIELVRRWQPRPWKIKGKVGFET